MLNSLNTLYAEHGDEIKALADEIKPCEYCSRKHHEEYIIHELLDQTLTDIIENDELSEYFD